MRLILLAILCSLFLTSSSHAADSTKPAAEIIQRYLHLPFPEEDPMGEARMARLNVLAEFKQHPVDAPAAIAMTLPTVNDPRIRRELVESLRHIPSRMAADVVVKCLNDADPQVRWEAIHTLRLYSRRVDRISPARYERGPRKDPDVEGLLPHLIAAANDQAPANRVCAAYALADAQDPAAFAKLRNMLKDEDRDVRFHVACFLTEIADASGLSELKEALERFRQPKNENDFIEFKRQMLLASMERITGKSFGPIPMVPGLMSDTRQMADAEAQYRRLLDTWHQWWTWQPHPDAR